MIDPVTRFETALMKRAVVAAQVLASDKALDVEANLMGGRLWHRTLIALNRDPKPAPGWSRVQHVLVSRSKTLLEVEGGEKVLADDLWYLKNTAVATHGLLRALSIGYKPNLQQVRPSDALRIHAAVKSGIDRAETETEQAAASALTPETRDFWTVSLSPADAKRLSSVPRTARVRPSEEQREIVSALRHTIRNAGDALRGRDRGSREEGMEDMARAWLLLDELRETYGPAARSSSPRVRTKPSMT